MSRRQTDPETVLAELREAIREARGILSDIKAERRAVRETVDRGAHDAIEQHINAACKEAFAELETLVKENYVQLNKHVRRVTIDTGEIIREGVLQMIQTGKTEWLDSIVMDRINTNESEPKGS